MKSNVQWYLHLPEPFKMQAVINAEKDDMLHRMASSMGEALCAFPWDTTPQGRDYWHGVFKRAEAGEIGKSVNR